MGMMDSPALVDLSRLALNLTLQRPGYRRRDKLAHQRPHRLGKAKTLGLHDEVEDVAPDVAAEALVGAADIADMETGSFLFVEGA